MFQRVLFSCYVSSLAVQENGIIKRWVAGSTLQGLQKSWMYKAYS